MRGDGGGDILAQAMEPCIERGGLITGSAGTGKTAWAAEVVRKHGRKVAAVHMCAHNDSTLSDPARMLLSVAAQLCKAIQGFGAELTALHQPDELHKLATQTSDLHRLFQALLQEV